MKKLILALLLILPLQAYAGLIEVRGVFASNFLSGEFSSWYESEDTTVGTGIVTSQLTSLTLFSSFFPPNPFDISNSSMDVIFDNRPEALGTSIKGIVVGANIASLILGADPIPNDFRVTFSGRGELMELDFLFVKETGPFFIHIGGGTGEAVGFVTQVPEPGTLGMMGAGLLGLGVMRRRRAA